MRWSSHISRRQHSTLKNRLRPHTLIHGWPGVLGIIAHQELDVDLSEKPCHREMRSQSGPRRVIHDMSDHTRPVYAPMTAESSDHGIASGRELDLVRHCCNVPSVRIAAPNSARLRARSFGASIYPVSEFHVG
jgi:hypothetical protein